MRDNNSNIYEAIWGFRLAAVVIFMIFLSSWLSCGNPDILDAIRTRIERKEK